MKKKFTRWLIEIRWDWRSFAVGFEVSVNPDDFNLVLVFGFWGIEIMRKRKVKDEARHCK